MWINSENGENCGSLKLRLDCGKNCAFVAEIIISSDVGTATREDSRMTELWFSGWMSRVLCQEVSDEKRSGQKGRVEAINKSGNSRNDLDKAAPQEPP